MREQGIEDDSIMKSLGVFAVSIALILLVFLIYFLIKRCKCCEKIKQMLYKKMCYSGPIRYIVVGYLKLLNQFAALLLFGMSSQMSIFMIIGYALVIMFLMLWPFWSSCWLMKNKDKLADPVFEQKFSTLYQGIRFDSFRALAYNAVFSVRRFDIILMNMFFTAQSPLSGIGDRT